jgi:hypothetical protein
MHHKSTARARTKLSAWYVLWFGVHALCHCVTVSLYSIIDSRGHGVTWSQCHCVTASRLPSFTVSFCIVFIKRSQQFCRIAPQDDSYKDSDEDYDDSDEDDRKRRKENKSRRRWDIRLLQRFIVLSAPLDGHMHTQKTYVFYQIVVFCNDTIFPPKPWNSFFFSEVVSCGPAAPHAGTTTTPSATPRPTAESIRGPTTSPRFR